MCLCHSLGRRASRGSGGRFDSALPGYLRFREETRCFAWQGKGDSVDGEYPDGKGREGIYQVGFLSSEDEQQGYRGFSSFLCQSLSLISSISQREPSCSDIRLLCDSGDNIARGSDKESTGCFESLAPAGSTRTSSAFPAARSSNSAGSPNPATGFASPAPISPGPAASSSANPTCSK